VKFELYPAISKTRLSYQKKLTKNAFAIKNRTQKTDVQVQRSGQVLGCTRAHVVVQVPQSGPHQLRLDRFPLEPFVGLKPVASAEAEVVVAALTARDPQQIDGGYLVLAGFALEKG